ncbi:MAG: hypothetical protein JXQ90_23775 [Cyclobacteriaceae bacterium]
MHFNFSFCVAFLLTLTCVGQEIQVGAIDINSSGNVATTAMIVAEHSDRERYDMSIYTSVDGFEQPLAYNLVELVPGEPFNISFNGPTQVGRVKGPIEFEFRIRASEFPVKVVTKPNSKWKAGKVVNIEWTDYLEAGWYDVELWQGGELKETLAESHRGLAIESTLPKALDKGKDYEVRVLPTNSKGRYSEMIPVMIVGFNPWIAIGPAIGAVGTGGFFLLTSGFEDPVGTPDGE